MIWYVLGLLAIWMIRLEKVYCFSELLGDLEERFGYTSMTQVYFLEQQLTEINHGNKSVSDYFTGIKTLWDAMNDANPLPSCTCNKCTCGVNHKI